MLGSKISGPLLNIFLNDLNRSRGSLPTQLYMYTKMYVYQNVIGPAKTGNVDTDYIPSHYRSYGTEYFHSVTSIIKPIKCLLYLYGVKISFPYHNGMKKL